jgi:hypothetical protein
MKFRLRLYTSHCPTVSQTHSLRRPANRSQPPEPGRAVAMSLGQGGCWRRHRGPPALRLSAETGRNRALTADVPGWEWAPGGGPLHGEPQRAASMSLLST